MTTPILIPDREERLSRPKTSAPMVRAEPNRVVAALQAAAREVADRMAATADKARDQAIEHVRRLGPETWREAPQARLTHEPGFLTPFKLGLAGQCARVLGASEPRVLSAFTYDLADHRIHLLLLVDETSAGLEGFVREFDRALSASIDELRLPDCFECTSVLDVHQVTPRDVRLGIGLAGLLSSVANAPLRVWNRHEPMEYPAPIVWHLSEVAETVCLEAVNLVRQHVPALAPIGHTETLVRRPDFIGPFRCGLAVCLGKVLGANDGRVRAVFHADPTESPLRLIVLVTEPTAALEAFIAALDRALSIELHNLHIPEFAGRDRVVEVHLITPKEVRLGLGDAALLAAVQSAPTRIWSR
jgi:hypothetical protein